MRFLTEKEVSQLETVNRLPLDLSQDYVPVSLRLLATCKDYDYGPGWRMDREDFDQMLKSAANHLNCELIHENYMHGSSKGVRPVKNEFQWNHFAMNNDSEIKYDATSQWVLFPLSHFLFAKDLKTYDVQMRPGYIYFGCKIECADHIHSILLDESPLQRIKYDWKLNLTDGMWYPKQKASSDTRPWRGPIADIEHLTNARIVHQSCRNSGRDGMLVYILETPLEFPPGFVRETANALKRDLPEGNKILERFNSLVFETPAKALPTTDISFPQGVANLHGPDVNWINSSHPWFVQTILMARLIGGEYWQYALGNLEANMHLCIEDM